ncbi:MAG: EamA family transporter [Firmicutes bacterium]|nr:EamA family transporter [Bacillota bacterium]
MFTKGALNFVTPNQLLAFRFTIAALVMTLLRALRLIKIELRGRAIKGVLLLALVQPVLYFCCETTGVNLTTSSEAGLMIALIPVFVTVLAALTLKEIPTPHQLFFIFLSVAGVVLIVSGGEGIEGSGHTFGLLALLGAVLAAAVYDILSRWLSTQFRPVEITFVMMWFGALFFDAAVLIELWQKGEPLHLLALLQVKEVWSALLYLGIFSSIIAFFCTNYALSQIEASRAAVFANLSTIISVVAGITFLGEPFYSYHLAGGGLILLGVWGTNRFGRG